MAPKRKTQSSDRELCKTCVSGSQYNEPWAHWEWDFIWPASNFFISSTLSTTGKILSQCLSTEDIQPINSNFFGRNSLPLLSLFYHFLEERLEGVVAITEGYFHFQILRVSPLLGLLCTNVCWDSISIAPRFSVLWFHTQDMYLVLHRWEGKGQIPEKHQTEPKW